MVEYKNKTPEREQGKILQKKEFNTIFGFCLHPNNRPTFRYQFVLKNTGLHCLPQTGFEPNANLLLKFIVTRYIVFT